MNLKTGEKVPGENLIMTIEGLEYVSYGKRLTRSMFNEIEERGGMKCSFNQRFDQTFF